jgi:hypothetical protein
MVAGMKAPLAFIVAIVMAIVLAGCGSQKPVAVRNGVIVLRHGIPDSSLFHGVLGVHVGSPSTEVQKTFGSPFRKISDTHFGQRETCWAYHAQQRGSSLDGLDFCVNTSGQVSRILIGEHL